MFAWRYLDEAGGQVGASERFANPADAEKWLGEGWRELAATGVATVTLVDEERGEVVYRMSLTEADR